MSIQQIVYPVKQIFDSRKYQIIVQICFPPVTAINSSIPKCKIEEESKCAKNIILRRKYDNNFLKKCETSCKTTQYTVTNQYFWNYNTTGNEPDQESKNWFWLWYMLSNDLGCHSQ